VFLLRNGRLYEVCIDDRYLRAVLFFTRKTEIVMSRSCAVSDSIQRMDLFRYTRLESEDLPDFRFLLEKQVKR
jgi:hypothetical protein